MGQVRPLILAVLFACPLRGQEIIRPAAPVPLAQLHVLLGNSLIGSYQSDHGLTLSGNLISVHAPPTAVQIQKFALPTPVAPVDHEKIAVLMLRARQAAGTPALDAPGDLGTSQANLAAAHEVLANIPVDALQKMPVDELDGVARLIMDRLQGVKAAAPSAAAPVEIGTPELKKFAGAARADAHGRSTYIMSKPLNVEVTLGPITRALHWVGEAGWHLVSAGLVYHATGNLHAAMSLGVLGFLKMPPIVTAQSAMDLSARYWWHKLKSLKELAQVPFVGKIKVLTGGETDIKGFVAYKRTNRGIIFLETHKPLPEGLETRYGKPVLIEDIENKKILVELSLGDKKSAVVWEPTLKDLLEKNPMPKSVARAWRADVRELQKGKSWFKRFFDYTLEKSMKVDVSLIAPNGSELALGTLAQGTSAKELLGITRIDQARRAAHKWLFGAVTERKERSIPLDDIVVEKKAADARTAWEKAKEFPRRLVRRLLGRLIVIHPHITPEK